MSYLIGVDVGTQGTKAALFDQDGRCLAEAFQKSTLITTAEGFVEEDPELQLESVCNTLRECIRKAMINPNDVAGLGIDGQMAGIIGVDSEGKHVTPYDSWLDTRCTPYIIQMRAEAGEDILKKTGGPPSINHGPKILWWMHERPEIFQKIRSFVQPGAYVAMRLCGLDGSKAFIDTTYLHFSGFADTRKEVWDQNLCRQFQLDTDKLPAIVQPHSIIGQITAEMSEQCGLGNIPLIAGCGDSAASFLSCGATRSGICVDVAGTASVFAGTEREFKIDSSGVLACGHAAVPDLWHPYAYINGGGMNLEWFRTEFSAAHGKDFSHLDNLLKQLEPQNDDPLFIPHLGGRVCPSQPEMKGSWVDLSWKHTLAHLYRAVLEGVALEYGLYLEILKSLYAHFSPSEVRITGGGGNSRPWNQIKADILGIPIARVSRNEGAPLGSALLAGFGTGLFSDLNQTANQWIEVASMTRPVKTRYTETRDRLERYRQYLAAFHKITENEIHKERI